MQIRGVPFHEVTRLTEVVSRTLYDGNVVVDRFARDLNTRKGGFAGRIIVLDSRGQGARRSSSGRRGPYACWHVFRDVLFAIFDAYPDASVRTSLAHYVGRAGFLDMYPGTGRKNVGSQVVPATMPSLCECDGNVPETAAENRERFERLFALHVSGWFRPAAVEVDYDLEYSPDAARWTPEDAAWLDRIGLTSGD